MESVPDLMHSALARWRAWSPMQRAVVGIAAGIIFVGALSIGFQSETTRYVPLSLGKQFSADELTAIEQNLREKSLTTFRREGNQLLVPEDEQTAYDAALLQERQLPQDWASEWEQKFEATNPFTSSRKLKMMKEIALAKELKRIIQGLDGIQEANVVWAETETHEWPSRQQKVTASVNIRPEPGHTLSEQTIRGIQFSVANMVSNLEPQDVVVFDYSIGRHYQLQPEQAQFETDLQQWIDRESSRWHERLLPTLQHYWPGAKLRIQPAHEELRRVAKNKLVTAPAGGLRVKPPTFQDIERQLHDRFPEYIHLKVTLPDRGKRDDSASRPQQISLEDEVLAVLIGWLPDSFDAHQLQVAVESHSTDVTRIDVAENEATSPSWQPVILLGAAGLLLLVVGRRFRSRSSELDQQPLKEAAESQNQIPSVAVADSAPRAVEQPTTPLGDPEQVADVLKHWLGSSHVAGEARPSPQTLPEKD